MSRINSSSRPSKPCNYFTGPGTCKKGGSCPFVHDLRLKPIPVVVTAGASGASGKSVKTKTGPAVKLVNIECAHCHVFSMRPQAAVFCQPCFTTTHKCESKECEEMIPSPFRYCKPCKAEYQESLHLCGNDQCERMIPASFKRCKECSEVPCATPDCDQLVHFERKSGYCVKCTQDYLNSNSVRCKNHDNKYPCDGFIVLRGDAVSIVGTRHEYCHACQQDYRQEKEAVKAERQQEYEEKKVKKTAHRVSLLEEERKLPWIKCRGCKTGQTRFREASSDKDDKELPRLGHPLCSECRDLEADTVRIDCHYCKTRHTRNQGCPKTFAN